MAEINFDRLRISAMKNANTVAELLDEYVINNSEELQGSERDYFARQITAQMNRLLSDVFTIASCQGKNETVNNVQGDLDPYFLEKLSDEQVDD